MKKTRILQLLTLITLSLSACSETGLYHLTWITDGQHTLSGNLPGDLVVLDGEVVLAKGARVEGNLHQLSGKVTINGEVVGDIIFLGGDLSLEPGANAGANLNLGNDNYRISPDARVAGKINTGTGLSLPDLPEQKPIAIWQRILRMLTTGTLLAAFAALLGRYFAVPVRRVSDAATNHFVVSGAMGFLVGLVGISLLITMAYTILLIPVTFLGLILMGAAVVYGWIAFGTALGAWANHRWKLKAKPSASAFWGTMAFFILQGILTSLPVVGALLGIALALAGLGAVFLTRLGLHRFITQSIEAVYEAT